jgi:hypothetical protein
VVTGGQLNILPRDSTVYQQIPTSPPPLIHVPMPSTNNPFVLCFIRGNIRVCHGCRQKYPKPPLPPLDLCVKHQEWQRFGPHDNQQTRYGNVYYHCNIPCLRTYNSDFQPSMMDIPPATLSQLLPAHTEYLISHMPGRLS